MLKGAFDRIDDAAFKIAHVKMVHAASALVGAPQADGIRTMMGMRAGKDQAEAGNDLAQSLFAALADLARGRIRLPGGTRIRDLGGAMP
jgi:hypothetical protein